MTVSDGDYGEGKPLDLTAEEAERFRKAFKNKEFVEMFQSYMEEISDPKNRQLYENELKQLEAERGNNITFLKPEPFFVVKTKLTGEWKGETGNAAGPNSNNSVFLDGVCGTKLFINIATSDLVDEPIASAVVQGSKVGQNWRLPYSIIPIRPDFDKQGQKCLVVDVVFHPNVKNEIASSRTSAFKNMLIGTAIEGIAKTYNGIPFSQENYSLPKLDYKGPVKSAVFRDTIGKSKDKAASAKNETSSVDFVEGLMKQQQDREVASSPVIEEISSAKDTKPITMEEPKYKLVYRSDVNDWGGYISGASSKNALLSSLPTMMLVYIDLPSIQKLSEIQDCVDIQPKILKLSSVPGKYNELLIKLPYPCLTDATKAKWDAKKRQLALELPVDFKTILESHPELEKESTISEIETETPCVEEEKSDPVKKEPLENIDQGRELQQEDSPIPPVDMDLLSKLEGAVLDFLD